MEQFFVFAREIEANVFGKFYQIVLMQFFWKLFDR